MTISLYIALLLRLRTDAAGAISKLLLVRHGGAPVAPEEIEGFVYPGPPGEPIRYCARVRGRLPTYAGEPCASETEALCSLIEQAHVDLEREGAEWLPFHLIEQLESDAEALAVYRREVPRMLAAAKVAAEALDDVAELG